MNWAGIADWMKCANEYGLWNMLSFFVLLPSVIGAFAIVIWRRRRVRHLNFYVTRSRDPSNYPHKINIEMRNYTGRSVVIAFPWFTFRNLRPDENAGGDMPSGEYEVKFPKNHFLSEIDCLLRHGENVATWIPIDPAHTDEEGDAAVSSHRVGRL